METAVGLLMVGVAMAAGLAALALPFWLLGLLLGWRPVPARARKPARASVKDEVVRAQWEYDRLWSRRK